MLPLVSGAWLADSSCLLAEDSVKRRRDVGCCISTISFGVPPFITLEWYYTYTVVGRVTRVPTCNGTSCSVYEHAGHLSTVNSTEM